MLSLPRTWHAGPKSYDCLISAYVQGIGRTTSTPVFGTQAPTAPTPTTGTTTTTSPSPPPPGVFCNVSAAYTDLTTGPHLCGWPDSTNTGYTHAAGYTGSLTTASSGSSTCPTIPVSGHTYSFCEYDGGFTLPAGLTGVTFYGDLFKATNPQNPNVVAGTGDNGITFNYDTFQRNTSAPPASCAQSYEYGIDNEGAQMHGFTVENSDFWGFGVAIDTSGSTQANPQLFHDNWIHDAADPLDAGGCNYHHDGIGMLNGGTESYATVDHNTIEFLGSTNLIAWQTAPTATSRTPTTSSAATTSCTPADAARPLAVLRHTSRARGTRSIPTWRSAHRAGATPSITRRTSGPAPATSGITTTGGATRSRLGPAYNGYYWVPTTHSQTRRDCGFVSQTD